MELSAESFGRLLKRIGSSPAARMVVGHALEISLEQAVGAEPGLRDRCRALVLRELLVFCRGNKSEMARVLGWGRRTLVRELSRLEIIRSKGEELEWRA